MNISELLNSLGLDPNNTCVVSDHSPESNFYNLPFYPKSPEEFETVVAAATKNQLVEMGFGYWSSVNSIVMDNMEALGQATRISVPILNANDIPVEMISEEQPDGITIDGHNLVLNIDRSSRPTTLLEKDRGIYLIPGPWYDFIPEGYMVTGLWGEEFPFIKAESSDDTRCGCLAYAVQKEL